MWITAVRNTHSLDCCMLHHGLRWNWGGGAFLLYWTLKLASRLILSHTYFILKFLAGAGGEGVHICEEFWHGFLKYHFKCSLTRWHAFKKKCLATQMFEECLPRLFISLSPVWVLNCWHLEMFFICCFCSCAVNIWSTCSMFTLTYCSLFSADCMHLLIFCALLLYLCECLTCLCENFTLVNCPENE